MKNRYICILTACSLLSVSCSDFLTETPTTNVVAEQAYTSHAIVESDLTGVYNSLQTFINSNYCHYILNCAAYQEWLGNRTTDEWVQAIYMTLFSTSSTSETFFKNMCIGASRANSLIEGIRNSSLEEEYKTQVEAEGRFLRALFYFYLVRTYGDIPLIDFVPKSLSDVNIPRTPYQKIYKFLLEELDFAFENMRTKDEQDAVSYDLARCYNYAAMALKAEVYMWIACYMESPEDQWFDLNKEGRAPDFSESGINSATEAWEKSLECAERVINDPDSPYALEPDFRNLFRWEPRNHPEDYHSPERIITVQNTINSSTANGMIIWALWANPYGTLSSAGKWSTAGRSRPSRWTWQEWGRLHGGIAGGNSKYPEAYTTIPDPRIDKTYAHTQVVAYDTNNAGKTKTTKIFPAITSSSVDKNHYYLKAFSASINGNNGDADSYLLRMGTIYLDAAEAAAALGQNEKALTYLNALLERARNSTDGEPSVEPKNYTSADFSSKADLINLIMWERVFEQDGEGHGFYDTHRRGATWLLENIVKPYNEFCKTPMQSGCADVKFYATKATMGAKYPDDIETLRACLVGAFPEYELQYNTALDEIGDQNDFFIK